MRWPWTRDKHADPHTRALWDAAGGGNRLANWTAPSTSFQTAIPAPLLKGRARDAYQDNPWARRARGIEFVRSSQEVAVALTHARTLIENR